MVRDEARRLAEMVEQVLDFAGSYSGRRAYRFEALEAGALARECAEAVAPLVNEAGGLLEVEVTPGLPPVSADPQALRRAVVNLLQNAVKYGGDSPRIRLHVAPAAARRPGVEISVQDHGLGIPPEEQARLFEPFFRGEEARARQIRGSGLGLSLVKRIVVAHGGRVGVASAPGRGSTFTLSLPAAGGLRAAAPLGTPGTHERPHTAG
jgi:signal transduction histidine kinase